MASESMPIGRRAARAAGGSGRARSRGRRRVGPAPGRVADGGLDRGADAELVRALLQRGDDEAHVVVEVDAELLGPAPDLLAVDRRREARLLELLLDRLRRQPVQP